MRISDAEFAALPSRGKPPAPKSKRKPSTSAKSKAHAALAAQLRHAGLADGMVEEYRFHPTRRWAFDLAWPSQFLAVEIEGAVWTNGRHTRGKGFIEDCEKYGEASILGFHVLRVPTHWVKDGTALDMVARWFAARKDRH